MSLAEQKKRTAREREREGIKALFGLLKQLPRPILPNARKPTIPQK
jgi:hypothetical protein